jgi:16S rRNA (cytosine1402-N4)-methyltransferase
MMRCSPTMTEDVSKSGYPHVPVMRDDVVRALDFQRPAVVVDGTLGMGGHTEALLATYPEMRVLGLEWDASALEMATGRLAPFGARFSAHLRSYAELPSILKQEGLSTVDGVLLDLGLSSKQLEDTDRGFSFLRPGRFDMRMSGAGERTAWDLLVGLSEEELAVLLRTYGEEPHARRVAQLLKTRVRSGELKNDAWDIAQAIRQAVPRGAGRTDPATRCFQALRIAVNHELENLDLFLTFLPELLSRGGRATIIAFHSLEDRRVKNAFQLAAKGCICPPQIPQCICGLKPWGKLISRKALQASDEEIQINPRARSARLRILEKL